MDDTVLSKDYAVMAKGIPGTISGWFSSMTADHRNRPGHSGRTEAFRVEGKVCGQRLSPREQPSEATRWWCPYWEGSLAQLSFMSPL